MILDLLDNTTAPRHFECDVFIAGAGPAGISLALELARARPDWHIVLGEAGGVDQPTQRERDIYQLELGDKSYSVLDICRRRQLGGTSIHWGGWSKPPDDTDFESNPQWQVPAWPIGREEFARYVPAACDWCEIDSPWFDVSGLGEARLLSLGENSPIAEHLFRFSPPTRFARRYTAELQEQENLTCLLHANLIRLEYSNERVTLAHVAPLDQHATRIEAKNFVLAMGGIETTRHLLNLRGDRKADGEGVYSPHLGRYFADHFGISPGLVLAPAELQYSRFADPSGPVMPVLAFAQSEVRDSGQNNSCIYLWAESGEGSLLDGYGGLTSLGFRAGEYWHYHVKMILEPQPNYDSSIALTDKVCALGLRRVRLDWRIHDADFVSAYQLMDTLGRELGGSGQGRMRITQGNTPALRAEVTGGCHHMGTVRMAASSNDGVTDANLKVFGSDNLYVASSAVIPRYGYSNPTLTTVALSVRLAHHLAGSDRQSFNDQASNDHAS